MINQTCTPYVFPFNIKLNPWYFDLYRKAYQKVKTFQFDIVVTFGQPMSTHLAGYKLKKKFPKIKWIAHFSDPWVDNPFNEYNWWTRYINRYYQDLVFYHADKLIFTSQETAVLVANQYCDQIISKTEFMPHCFDESFYPQKLCNVSPYFIVRYLGNFYGNRQPSYLFNALKIIPNSELKDVRFEFIGDSTLKIEVEAPELKNVVTTRPLVNYLDSLKLMSESNLLLIMDAPTAGISPFLPSKLIDYVGANRPIFGITPCGTSQKLIEEMKFLTADPNDHNKVANNLMKMIRHVRSGEIAHIPNKIRNRFSVATVGNQMSEIFLNMLKDTRFQK
ncbi:MAG: glycosyltransferase [Oligoflexia bacterium]|nr:glycosyltransferase [Oligoflexia bacterium]